MHIGGFISRYWDVCKNISKKFGCLYLEDSAQAFGSKTKCGLNAGCIGEASIHSFHLTKVLTGGEGGLALCDVNSGMYCNSGNSWCAKHPIPKCKYTKGGIENPGVACSCGYSNCCTAINLPHCKKITGLYCYADRSSCRDNREFFGYTSYGIQDGHNGL